MEFLKEILDIFLHLDDHLFAIVNEYQTTTYLILCLIIFCETGLVATPILPGDSLLFAAGLVCSQSTVLNVWLLIFLLIVSAIAGDNANYFIGKKLGTRLFEMRGLRKILKREYLERTHTFYEKHGGKTIIIARFVPIIRTFAPFVAGLGSMTYSRYIIFCLLGAFLWVPSITLLGYFFGNLPVVRENFELVVFGIIAVSLIPVVIQFFKMKFSKKLNA